MLVDPTLFDPMFIPLQGKLVGYVRQPGNVGDKLKEAGTTQLFKRYGVERYEEPLQKGKRIKADVLVFSAGGTMGKTYRRAYKMRQAALKTGKPFIIFPQSFCAKEPISCHKLFVRERYSLEFNDNAILAPDPALAYELPVDFKVPAPTRGLGISLKSDDDEGIMSHPKENGDPIKRCKTVLQYIHLAAQYNKLVTDRCHFAIAAMIAEKTSPAGREVCLVANSYHKNLGLWEAWLKDLGAKWLTRKELLAL